MKPLLPTERAERIALAIMAVPVIALALFIVLR